LVVALTEHEILKYNPPASVATITVAPGASAVFRVPASVPESGKSYDHVISATGPGAGPGAGVGGTTRHAVVTHLSHSLPSGNELSQHASQTLHFFWGLHSFCVEMSACALAKNSDIWLAVGAASAELEAAARMAKVMKDAIDIDIHT